MIHIDIETRSHTDLTTRGVYNYAQDPSTEVLCICYAEDNGRIRSWTPSQSFPLQLIDAIERGDELWAHNAQFERLLFDYVICNDYDCPRPKLEQWRCTATLARGHALPGSLDACARALNLRHKKDKRGAELIKLMSIPPFEHTPELLNEMVEYCKQDVRVERMIHSTLPPLPDHVWRVYQTSERINDRGVLVDVELARAALPLADTEQGNINEELTALTEGAVTKPRSPKLAAWVHERLPDRYKPVIEDASKKSGLSLDGSRVDELLQLENRINEQCELSRVVELKALASKSSVAKFQALIDLADDEDQRVRGALVHLGAGQTGRWSSRGLQIHNFPRASAEGEDFDKLRADAISGRLHGNVMRSLSKLLRPSLMAPEGKTFVSVDWSAIEARALPWLSGDPRAESVLDVFRAGEDIYMKAAESMGPQYDRQIGKVATLALGYQGGVGAFQAMARGYRVSVDDDMAQRVVRDWRRANAWAQAFWGDLEMGLAGAMTRPSYAVPVGRVAYRYEAPHMFCELPSGRTLMYPFISRDVEETQYGPRFAYTCIKSSLVPSGDKPWPRMQLYGGILCENITQGVCADLLAHLLLRLETERPYWPCVMHVHDQVVLEVPKEEGPSACREVEQMMSSGPTWAEGLPLAAEGWHGPRFKK